jgi:hypothetical protein
MRFWPSKSCPTTPLAPLAEAP